MLVACLTVAVGACERYDELALTPVGTPYFPLITGAVFVYDVDSVAIRQNVETLYRYQLQIVVTDSFRNESGSYNYILQRSIRPSAASAWRPADTWQVRSDANQVVVQEGNIAFVRLALPVEVNKSWNGNAFNTLGGIEDCGDRQNFTCDIYTIVSENTELVLTSGETINRVTEVVENNDPDVITITDIRRSWYAVNLGLVKRDITYLEFCTSSACLGRRFVENGLRYTMELNAYEGL